MYERVLSFTSDSNGGKKEGENALHIDHEFADQIPPLTEEEYRQLEMNILQDGEVINPIIVWNGTIVDGHNRYRILQEHLEVPYKTCGIYDGQERSDGCRHGR